MKKVLVLALFIVSACLNTKQPVGRSRAYYQSLCVGSCRDDFNRCARNNPAESCLNAYNWCIDDCNRDNKVCGKIYE